MLPPKWVTQISPAIPNITGAAELKEDYSILKTSRSYCEWVVQNYDNKNISIFLWGDWDELRENNLNNCV